jgi:hypothetical protein
MSDVEMSEVLWKDWGEYRPPPDSGLATEFLSDSRTIGYAELYLCI